MKPYFLSLFLLPFFTACNNASGTRSEKKTDSNRPASASPDSSSAVQSDSPGVAQPDPTSATAQPGDKRTDTAALNLEVALESTLSPTRTNISLPPFSLDKIMATIRKMHIVDDPVEDRKFTIALSDTIYNALSLDEKFTYNMIHAESYSQMCDMLPEHMEENDRIYGQLIDLFGEYSWSKRQLDFLKNNGDSVEQLMKAVIDNQGKVGMNFLDVIVTNNDADMIPYLIDVYRKDPSNHYILTTLILLMEKNRYPEFMQSLSYRKLYLSAHDTYSAYLVYNKANEDLIIRRATDFYTTLHDTVRQ